MLKIDIHSPVATVTLDRPELHNAFNDELILKVTEAFRELGARSDLRAIILAGAGKSFCAGGDLNWMKRMVNYTREENLSDARALATMFHTIATCPKPVIARVHGAALGGGAGLVAACDISIAVESTQFAFTEVKLGIIPAVISPFVIARTGIGPAREYFLTGDRFPAPTAVHIGLLGHSVPDADSADRLIQQKVAQLLTGAPGAIAAAKKLIFEVHSRTLDQAMEYAAAAIADARAGEEGQAGMKAFLERQKAPWIA